MKDVLEVHEMRQHWELPCASITMYDTIKRQLCCDETASVRDSTQALQD